MKNRRPAHEVLGISQLATLEEIKFAFRAKAKVLHPDVYGGKSSNSKIDKDKEDEDERKRDEAFLELRKAYEQLTEKINDADENDDRGLYRYGPGMRARMFAAKSVRGKYGYDAGTVRAARDWTSNMNGGASESDSYKSDAKNTISSAH